jgi:hypothetical protein
VDRLMTTRQNLWKKKLAFKRSVSVFRSAPRVLVFLSTCPHCALHYEIKKKNGNWEDV